MQVHSATLSNCGKVLKLCIPTKRRKTVWGRGNDLGYGKNCKDVTMGNPQPSPKSFSWKDMDAVQRLNGNGFFFHQRKRGLRYSLSHRKSVPMNEASIVEDARVMGGSFSRTGY